MIFDSVKDMLTSEGGLAFNAAVQLILGVGADRLANHQAQGHGRQPQTRQALGCVREQLDDCRSGIGGAAVGEGGAVGGAAPSQADPGASQAAGAELRPRERRSYGGDPVAMLLGLALAAGSNGITLDDAAVEKVRGTKRADDTWRAHSQSVKRVLDKLVAKGNLTKTDGQIGGSGGGVFGPRWTMAN